LHFSIHIIANLTFNNFGESAPDGYCTDVGESVRDDGATDVNESVRDDDGTDVGESVVGLLVHLKDSQWEMHKVCH
jgi:hypothetical protein